MNFSEAMKKLESGSKITRQEWMGRMYFLMKENRVRCFHPILLPYPYDEDIMISEGWIIECEEKEFKFYDIITHLINGSKAKLKHWDEMYILFDKVSKCLAVYSMNEYPYTPEFDSFVATDWVELS